MIDVKNITKSFGSLQVLKGIDLHIDRGEVVSIDTSGSDAKIDVVFNDGQTRKLLLKFAKFEIL